MPSPKARNSMLLYSTSLLTEGTTYLKSTEVLFAYDQPLCLVDEEDKNVAYEATKRPSENVILKPEKA